MKLSEFKFNDLLPMSIREEPKIKAASQCLDMLFRQTYERNKQVLIYSRIDDLGEEELTDLAWQFNLDWYEGWSLATNIEEKRELVKNAIVLKWHKGTRWSIERIAEILDMPLEVIEWWEYNELGTTLEPYEFEIHVDAAKRGVSKTFYTELENLVQNLKNVRSHMRRIQAILAIKQKVFVGACKSVVDFVRIYPELKDFVESKQKLYLHCGNYDYESVDVFPCTFRFYLVTENGEEILTENGKKLLTDVFNTDIFDAEVKDVE